jgi:hypothetical protein
MRRWVLLVGCGAMVALLVRGGCACASSSNKVTREDSGAPLAADAFVRIEATAPAGDVVVPPGVPAGWVPFTDYGNLDCHFFVPTSRDALPGPIEWQPCNAGFQPTGSQCQQMRITWQVPPDGWGVGHMLGEEWLQADGTYTTAFARLMPGMTYYVVADADGPVHSALLALDETRCKPSPQGVRDGRVVYSVYEADSSGQLSEYGGGAIVAGIDDLRPRAYLRFGDKIARGYDVGLPGVLEGQSYPTNLFRLHDWADPSKILMQWSTAQDNGLQEIPSSFSGQALFWEAVADPAAKLKVWTADAGVLDLLAFRNDTSQGAGDLGTDGKDLVWLQGSGRVLGYGPYPNAVFMTSPFTTNPAQLQPRRLRSEPGGDAGSGLGASLIQVGCGYAARESPVGIRILRLSDGVSWFLPLAGAPWGWSETVAVTCTYFYGTAIVTSDGASAPVIARIRLDSLGPGIAPN